MILQKTLYNINISKKQFFNIKSGLLNNDLLRINLILYRKAGNIEKIKIIKSSITNKTTQIFYENFNSRKYWSMNINTSSLMGIIYEI